jgi:hypothetical protein
LKHASDFYRNLFGHVEGFATGLGDGNWHDYDKLLDDDVR